MKICHISTVHPLFDDRIFYKQCKTLNLKDYDVHLIIQHIKNEKIDGIFVHRIGNFKSRLNRFFKGNWVAFIRAFRISADIYQIHDPELMFCGLILKLFKKRIIFDFHELVYYQIENKEWLSRKWGIKFIRAFYFFIEKKSISCFDAIILAEDGYKEYFNQFYPKYKYKFFYIRNYAILSFIDKYYTPGLKSPDKKIIYLGSISRDRGIKEMILALEMIKVPVRLILLGKWDNIDYLNECKALKGWENVDYLGFKRLEEVYRILNSADIGLVMLHPIKNYVTSLPVKAFEYMAMKKPIVMSNFAYWKEIFSDCALFANPEDPGEIADKIQLLLSNDELYTRLADGGRKLVEEAYNWEKESEDYLKVIDFVLQNKCG